MCNTKCLRDFYTWNQSNDLIIGKKNVILRVTLVMQDLIRLICSGHLIINQLRINKYQTIRNQFPHILLSAFPLTS